MKTNLAITICIFALAAAPAFGQDSISSQSPANAPNTGNTLANTGNQGPVSFVQQGQAQQVQQGVQQVQQGVQQVQQGVQQVQQPIQQFQQGVQVIPQGMPVTPGVVPGQIINPGAFSPNYIPPSTNYIPNNVYNPGYNPVVGYKPSTVNSVTYDQFGRPIVNSNSQTVMNSALNAGRNIAVAGTTRKVNRTEFDSLGRRVQVTGTEWLGADGQWHGNLNRQTVTIGATGVINNQNDVINFGRGN